MLPFRYPEPAIHERRILVLRAEAYEARLARSLASERLGTPRRRLGRALITLGRRVAAEASPLPARTP
jgi:hypothetical protein